MNNFFTLLAALFCLLSLTAAQTFVDPPTGTLLTECTVQVFATGMHNKGIIVSTYIPFPWTNYIIPTTHEEKAQFGAQKASVFLRLPIHETHLLNQDIVINFTATNYVCDFGSVRLSNVNTDGAGTGKCFKILQQCSTLPYGTVYIDMWCDVPYQPSYPFDVIKMNYQSQGLQVSC